MHILVVLQQMYRDDVDFNLVEGQRLQDLKSRKGKEFSKMI